MGQNKAVDETKKLTNLKTHNTLLRIAIILQCIHLPIIALPIIINVLSFLLPTSHNIPSILVPILGLPLVYGAIIYIFRWYYWGIVIIEGIFLLIFLFKTGDVFNAIKKEKKKYILFQIHGEWMKRISKLKDNGNIYTERAIKMVLLWIFF